MTYMAADFQHELTVYDQCEIDPDALTVQQRAACAPEPPYRVQYGQIGLIAGTVLAVVLIVIILKKYLRA